MRARMIRKMLAMSVLVLLSVAAAWGVSGGVAQEYVLARYREDYEIARSGKPHPALAGTASPRQVAHSAQDFIEDYQELERSSYFMAASRAIEVWRAHDDYLDAVEDEIDD